MIKFAVNQWDKNKDKLEKDIIENLKDYNDFSYVDLVKKMVDFIFNDEESEDYPNDKYNSESITEINNGDWQGTLIYMIPTDSYQPSADDYLMTYSYYGSCSGCDTLQSIQSSSYYIDEDDKESEKEISQQAVKDYMGLILNLVQNTIKPYNNGWDSKEIYNTVVM